MSTKSLGKPLTADLVFTKTKSDSLQNIKNLNLWGNDLEDLSLLQKMPNLQVISLSVNRISSLKDFSKCMKLQELYLRKNNIADLKQIRYLVNLPSLKVLWLHDNPCAQIEYYRQIVVKFLPNLSKLDNNPVTPEERTKGQNMPFTIDVPNNQSNYKSQKTSQQQFYQQKKPKPSSYHQIPSQADRQNESEHISQASYFDQPKYNQQQFAKKAAGFQNNSNVNTNNSVASNNKKSYDAPSNRDRDRDRQQDMSRNQNILMAVLSLLRQLDNGSLQIVKRQAQKMQK